MSNQRIDDAIANRKRITKTVVDKVLHTSRKLTIYTN